MSKERIKSIDFCKGIAILLVVLGHATEHTNASLSYDWLYKYIYSFHMPLFMFISGFVSYKNKYNWNSKQQNGIVKKDFFGKDK